MKLVIPTLGRIDKQITFENIPKKFHSDVRLVVQTHEYEAMKERYGDLIVCLPENVKNIARTREWIFNHFCSERMFVFDDDLKFSYQTYKLNEEGAPKWTKRKCNEQEFDDMLALVNSWMDQGIVFGGILPASVISDITQYPIRKCTRVMSNVFYDGPKMPKDLEWCRVPFAEDIDVTLQLLTRGYENWVSAVYRADFPTANPGGCSLSRTLESHNESSRMLVELWPEFVKLNEKELKTGPWAGDVKAAVRVYTKKAYQSSQRNNLADFFG